MARFPASPAHAHYSLHQKVRTQKRQTQHYIIPTIDPNDAPYMGVTAAEANLLVNWLGRNHSMGIYKT